MQRLYEKRLLEPFLALMPLDLEPGKPPLGATSPGESMVIVQRAGTTTIANGPARMAPVFGPGVWELQVAHKGVPLAAALERLFPALRCRLQTRAFAESLRDHRAQIDLPCVGDWLRFRERIGGRRQGCTAF